MIKIRIIIREVNQIGEKIYNLNREVQVEMVEMLKEMKEETIEIIEIIEIIEKIETIEIIEIIIETTEAIMIIREVQGPNSRRLQIKSNQSLRKNNKNNKKINL